MNDHDELERIRSDEHAAIAIIIAMLIVAGSTCALVALFAK